MIYVTNNSTKSKPVISVDDFKIVFIRDKGRYDEEVMYAFDAGHLGRITILSRMTGFGWRDVETGFRDTYAMNAKGKENYGKNFWLASGNFDVRDYIQEGGSSWDDLVELIKNNANTCVGFE
jgi:hypothetical protein